MASFGFLERTAGETRVPIGEVTLHVHPFLAMLGDARQSAVIPRGNIPSNEDMADTVHVVADPAATVVTKRSRKYLIGWFQKHVTAPGGEYSTRLEQPLIKYIPGGKGGRRGQVARLS